MLYLWIIYQMLNHAYLVILVLELHILATIQAHGPDVITDYA